MMDFCCIVFVFFFLGGGGGAESIIQIIRQNLMPSWADIGNLTVMC